jgi:hypothetical protein
MLFAPHAQTVTILSLACYLLENLANEGEFVIPFWVGAALAVLPIMGDYRKMYTGPILRHGHDHELFTAKLSAGSGRSAELHGLQNPSLF